MSRFCAIATASIRGCQKPAFWVAVALVGLATTAASPARADLIFQLPSIELNGETTGTIDVAVEVTDGGNPAQIAGYNIDFSVVGTDAIKLGVPVLPASGALLPAGTLFDGDVPVNERVLVGVDSDPVDTVVGTHLMLQVPFEITDPSLTGSFPLQFGQEGFNLVSDAAANPINPTLADGQIVIVPEPMGGLLAAAGLALLGCVTRRRRSAR